LNHFKYLFKHELRQHIHSLKFLTMGAFAIVFGLLSIYIQTTDYTTRKIIYDEEKIVAREAMSSATVYSALEVPIVIPPSPLSIFSKGVDDKVGSKIEISILNVPRFENAAQKKNSFLDIFETFDLVTLVHILFSVMTLFLVADTIAGDREEGTLKQTFSNSVLKSQYFLAKYLGSLLVLAIPLTVIYLTAAIIMLVHPLIVLTGGQWGSVLVIYICSVAFVSIYVLIGLTVSAKMRSSSLSTLVGLLIWIALVFIYPNAVGYVVKNFIEVPSNDKIETRLSNIDEEIKTKVVNSLPENSNRRRIYSWAESNLYGLFTLIGVAEKGLFEYHLNCLQKAMPIVLSGQERLFQAKYDFKKKYIRQREVASNLTRFLPGHLLFESTEKLAGTHYQERDFIIIESAKQYRSQFIDYMRSKGGFGFSFFTRMPPELMQDNWSDYPEGIMSTYSPRKYTKLNIDDMPVYTLPKPSLAQTGAIIDLMLLLFLNIILFISGGLMFSKSDVRN